MALFGKKKGSPGMPGPMDLPASMPSNLPTDAVMAMKQQGFSNNQIIQELQRQGYNPQQIFDAINMADPANTPAGPINNFNAPSQEMPSFSGPTEMPSQRPQYSSADESKQRIEEMAEAIIDEKWEDLVKSINKIIEWKEKIEGDIGKIEQEIKDIKENFNQLHSSIIGRINEYDKNITNVGTEIKAMEKVFGNILPTFTENVSELKRIVKGSGKSRIS